MSDITVRKPVIDLSAPFEKHWCGNDAFKTAFFNALSYSFPAGEQFFIDSVKMGYEALTPEQKEQIRDDVRGFNAQESIHRLLHGKFNEHLAAQGMKNLWEVSLLKWRETIADDGIAIWLGGTAAAEHFTAVLSNYLLERPWVFDNTEDRLRDFWAWHCSEESEHRSVAFDLFKMHGGDEKTRLYTFRVASRRLMQDFTVQFIHNLWVSGDLFKLSTWRSGFKFMFGNDGMARVAFREWKRYKDRSFHPSQMDGSAGINWLATHKDVAPAIGAARKPSEAVAVA